MLMVFSPSHFDVIISTHSPAIIHDNYDLMIRISDQSWSRIGTAQDLIVIKFLHRISNNFKRSLHKIDVPVIRHNLRNSGVYFSKYIRSSCTIDLSVAMFNSIYTEQKFDKFTDLWSLKVDIN